MNENINYFLYFLFDLSDCYNYIPEVLDYLESKKEFDRIQGLMFLLELEMNNLEETMLFNKKYC